MVWWERLICQYCVHANGDESVRQRSGIEVGQYCVHANGDESVRQRSGRALKEMKVYVNVRSMAIA